MSAHAVRYVNLSPRSFRRGGSPRRPDLADVMLVILVLCVAAASVCGCGEAAPVGADPINVAQPPPPSNAPQIYPKLRSLDGVSVTASDLPGLDDQTYSAQHLDTPPPRALRGDATYYMYLRVFRGLPQKRVSEEPPELGRQREFAGAVYSYLGTFRTDISGQIEPFAAVRGAYVLAQPRPALVAGGAVESTRLDLPLPPRAWAASLLVDVRGEADNVLYLWVDGVRPGSEASFTYQRGLQRMMTAVMPLGPDRRLLYRLGQPGGSASISVAGFME